MTPRSKLWLCAFLLGFAIGVVVVVVLSRPSAPPYQLEPLQETPVPGADFSEFTQTAHQMGTTINLKAHASERALVQKAFKAAFDRVHEIECIMSTFRLDSPLAKINAAQKAGDYPVPEELGMVIAKSLDFCRLTRGALDITIRPLLDIYKAAAAHGRAPTREEISKALTCVGYKKVSVSEDLRSVTLPLGMMLDLNATAKGYAADEAARVLRERGFKHAFVEAGGDMRFVGPRADGKPWTTGIQRPGGEKGEVLGILALSDGAACTSGNYAQGYWLGKEKVSHIIDPRTGQPCDRTPSVTVVAPDALTADALATALSVLGKDGLEIVEQMEGVEALILSDVNGKLTQHASSGFGRLLRK